MPKKTLPTDPQKLARFRIMEKYKFYGGWRDVADELKENIGMIWNVAHGKKKASLRLLEKLDIPSPRQALAPICPKCKIVHSKTCRILPEWVNQAADWLAERQKEKADDKLYR